jgi:hypothetical protein
MNNNIKTTVRNGHIYLKICDIDLILDDEQIEHIMNTNKKWQYDIEINRYPYYESHNKKRFLINFLYGKEIEINIKNNNIYDLRKSNIIIKINKHKYQDIIDKYYNTIEYNQGHLVNGKFYNPYWKYINLSNEIKYIILCSDSYLVEISNEQYENLIKYEDNIKYKLTLCYTFIKCNWQLISQYNNKQININTIIDNFNIKYIKNDTVIDFTDDIAREIYILKKHNNTNFIEKIERKNIINMIKTDKYVKETYKLLKIYRGHINKLGTDAKVEKNRMWKVYDEEQNKNIYLMYCEPNKLVHLCKKSIYKIKEFEQNNTGKITWYFHPNGYIQGSNNMYIHQVITGCYGNGQGTMDISVDHIDRNKLNNCFDNLRIATREEQEANTKSADGERRERKHNAKPLPEGITNDMMKKYIVYYKECYNKEKNLYREFFKIERHPKLDKPWIGSKSNKVSILDKLKEVNDMVDSINNQNDDNNQND